MADELGRLRVQREGLPLLLDLEEELHGAGRHTLVGESLWGWLAVSGLSSSAVQYAGDPRCRANAVCCSVDRTQQFGWQSMLSALWQMPRLQVGREARLGVLVSAPDLAAAEPAPAPSFA